MYFLQCSDHLYFLTNKLHFLVTVTDYILTALPFLLEITIPYHNLRYRLYNNNILPLLSVLLLLLFFAQSRMSITRLLLKVISESTLDARLSYIIPEIFLRILDIKKNFRNFQQILEKN